MYCLMGNDYRYYAGKSCSDGKTPVWKGDTSRALGFTTIENALAKAKEDQIFYLGVRYKDERL